MFLDGFYVCMIVSFFLDLADFDLLILAGELCLAYFLDTFRYLNLYGIIECI